MVLQPNDIKQILENAAQDPEVAAAVREEHRAKMHSEAPRMNYVGAAERNPAFAEFLNWVGLLIDKNKFEVFRHLLVDPIPTVDIVSSVFREVSKIYDGRDRFVGYQFQNPRLEVDYMTYLKEIEDEKFWSTTIFTAIKNGYNGFIIIDLPNEIVNDNDGDEPPMSQLMPRPTPYTYFLPTERVLRFLYSNDGRLEWLFFKDVADNNIGYIIDDQNYYTLAYTNENWTVTSTALHGLGYVPAKQVWSELLNHKSKFRRNGLLTDSLAELDKILFKHISKDHAELYSEYPITTMYEQKCDYRDPQGNMCDGGRIRSWSPNGFSQGNQMIENYVECPKCKGGSIKTLGAGTLIEAPAMAKEGDPDLLDAVRFVTVPTDSLNYIKDNLTERVNKFTYSIIGVTDEINNGQAINEKQVFSQYETRQNVLMRIKHQVELVHLFAIETMARLRYDKAFVGATVDYGTQFFIQTADQVMTTLTTAKTNGVPAFELEQIRQQYYASKYRSNPDMQERIKILSQIEPYQDYSIMDIQAMLPMGLFDEKLLMLKVDFTNYIARFEREYTDITMFMQYVDYDTKIDAIVAILMEYVAESKAAIEPQPPTPSAQPDNSDDDPQQNKQMITMVEKVRHHNQVTSQLITNKNNYGKEN